MSTIYTYESKKKIAERIEKLKRKKDMVKICEIIYNENKQITENSNGLYMLFNNLSDDVYKQIEDYLNSINCRTNNNLSQDKLSNDSSDTKNNNYDKNDFPDQNLFEAKLKYSNKERNLIKRNRYNNDIENEQNNPSDTKIIYTPFDTDSDLITTE